VWTYDFAAPSATLKGDHSFQSTWVRNVLAGINDYHKIGPSSNVKKVGLMLGNEFPILMFVTSTAVRANQEALLEYGFEWYRTFCQYYPDVGPAIFRAQSHPLDSMSLGELLQRLETSNRRDRKPRSETNPLTVVTAGLNPNSPSIESLRSANSTSPTFAASSSGSTVSSMSSASIPFALWNQKKRTFTQSQKYLIDAISSLPPVVSNHVSAYSSLHFIEKLKACIFPVGAGMHSVTCKKTDSSHNHTHDIVYEFYATSVAFKSTLQTRLQNVSKSALTSRMSRSFKKRASSAQEEPKREMKQNPIQSQSVPPPLLVKKSSTPTKRQPIKGTWYLESEAEWKKREEKQRKERGEFLNDEEYASFLQAMLNSESSRTARRRRE
jgi:hypothetical protein